MAVTITNTQNELLFQSDLEMGVGVDQTPFSEISYTSNESFWQSEANEVSMNGIHMAYHRVNIFETVQLCTTEHRPMPGLFFVENGTIETMGQGNDDTWKFESCEHNFLYNAYSTNYTRFPKQKDLRLFILSFTPEKLFELAEGNGKFVETFAENVASAKSISMHNRRNLRIDSSMHEAIRSIKTCGFAGSARKLYFESKALELLALQLHQFEAAEDSVPRFRITERDKRKLHDVKHLLEANLTEDHSLSGLAKLSGLNEFKLKYGFKQLFGETVFGYLANHRLATARAELKNSNKSLTQIAYETGFSSLQHFSSAYRKRYGASPGKHRNY